MKNIIPFKIMSRKKYNAIIEQNERLYQQLDDIRFLISYAREKDVKPIELDAVELLKPLKFKPIHKRVINCTETTGRLVAYINENIERK